MSNATLTRNEVIRIGNYEDEIAPIFDKNGNPTAETLESFQEDEDGLIEFMTLEDFKAELDEIRRSIKSI